MTIDFDRAIHHVNSAGTRQRVAADATGPIGGSASLGQLIRNNINEQLAPTSAAVGRELIRTLRGTRSHWPSTGRTANRGPWATNRSVNSFRVMQTRTERGAFTEVSLVNDARNHSGRAYAGFVDQGIGAGPVRQRANMRAVLRTWFDNAERILRAVTRRQA